MNRRKNGVHSSSSFQDEDRLERLYKTHYHGLLDYASSILQSDDAAEDVVQDLFIHLLQTNARPTLTKSYLYTSVRNRAYDVLRGQKVRDIWATEQRQHVNEEEVTDGGVEQLLWAKELEERINLVLDEMPVRRREIFLLARYQGFTYKEIASMLNISVNVVDKQMGKALAAFRARLQQYFTTLLISIMSAIIFL